MAKTAQNEAREAAADAKDEFGALMSKICFLVDKAHQEGYEKGCEETKRQLLAQLQPLK